VIVARGKWLKIGVVQRGLALAVAEKDQGVSAKAGRNRIEGSGLYRSKRVEPGIKCALSVGA